MNMNQIINQTEESFQTDELYHINHEEWIAREAAKLGFPIAGFIEDIYEDAVILFGPTFRFDWTAKKVKMGRVIHISKTEYFEGPVNFVLIMEDGTQVPYMYGRSHDCFFALPENTTNVFNK